MSAETPEVWLDDSPAQADARITRMRQELEAKRGKPTQAPPQSQEDA